MQSLQNDGAFLVWVKCFFPATFSSRSTFSFWVFFSSKYISFARKWLLYQPHLFGFNLMIQNAISQYAYSDTSCNLCRGQTLNKIFAAWRNGRTVVNHDNSLFKGILTLLGREYLALPSRCFPYSIFQTDYCSLWVNNCWTAVWLGWIVSVTGIWGTGMENR